MIVLQKTDRVVSFGSPQMMAKQRTHTDIIWFSLAIASFPGAASLGCSACSELESIPRPRAGLVLISAEGNDGVESGSLTSSRVAVVSEGSLGAVEGTAGDRGC